MCRAPEAAENGLRLDALGKSISITVLTVTPAGKRDARPFHAQRPGVGRAVGRIVQRGKDVVEQVFDAKPETVKIALRLPGDIPPPRFLGTFGSENIVAEPCGEHASTPFD